MPHTNVVAAQIDQKEAPGRLPSPGASTPEHPPSGEAGRRSQGRVWHGSQEIVDALVAGLGPVSGFPLTPMLAEALGARVSFLLGAENYTEAEGKTAFSSPLHANEEMTIARVLERCKNIATTVWLRIELAREDL